MNKSLNTLSVRRAVLFPCLILIIGLNACRDGSTGPSPQPNFLLVMTDNHSWPHTGAYGCGFTETPAFDKMAGEGLLFNNAFASAPSCSPSRAALLTGQAFYRMEWAAMNHTRWPDQTLTYADLLAEDGYHVGFAGKGWGPGNWEISHPQGNPAGEAYNTLTTVPPIGGISLNDYSANFADFLHKNAEGKPFCFWVGISEPHRIFEQGGGIKMGKDPSLSRIPGCYPDVPVIRNDITDYAYEIEYQDRHLGIMIEHLAKHGLLENTVIIMLADNGMAFPRAMATCYDLGTRVPLAIRWGGIQHTGRKVEDMVSLTDLAPTILELAGLEVPGDMTGKSLVNIMESDKDGIVDETRDAVVTGLERHFPGGRENGNCYPIRALRTHEYLYIRNYEPDRMPSGNFGYPVWPDDDPTGGYGDTDGSPTKTWIIENKDSHPEWFILNFGLRPAEELYEIINDPWQMNNLAKDPAYTEILKTMSGRLDKELMATADPRAEGRGDIFEKYASTYPSAISDTTLLK
jgi:N-sulfoglucosamine sulfohydrolase